ncbi:MULTISPECIES: inositol monophosphatase family protein [Lentibacter]|jgi:histidinol phosphatase-like enzyme (inositol monophosphatase family)|uniref:Histidinol-phosphatase, inositol monophosphatase family n=1 Tax=Lentibacter algarum TaxID=576131 RepID=A0A1H3K0F3_9RHOB|nr:inositol monophosphatase family protein [Lentibacter algarum]MCO4778347.1 inositol monophosphatase family protein [Lentibacter algarum]WIF32212.1 histidinol-phosphatase, inositol monophosphatase family [Lentibacter algarum]SDY45631.1 histidinol-phosphatase, inositol monophosphatase family [Lentibacter algarum]
MTQHDIKEIARTAHALAEAARGVVLPYFRSAGLSAENKLSEGFDPVTAADKAAEQVMRSVLAEQRPDDAIIGEEFGVRAGRSGLTWVLDPIDGTRGFLAGTPTWGILISVCDAGGPIFGMIDQPYVGERFWGGFGEAEMTGPMGESSLRVRGSRALSEAILFTTFPEVGSTAERAGFEAVAQHVKLTRFGMDCYAYALLAAGQIDLVIEAGLSNYDICAPIALIEAAGGIVTDWKGGKAHDGGRVLAAAGPEQHRAALNILSHFS